MHLSLRQAFRMPALPPSSHCALRICAVFVGLLASAQSSITIGPAPPTPAEQDKLLAAIGQYAKQYVSNLPNFLCIQSVRQFEAGRKPTRWHRGDMLTFRLTFNHGHEDHFLERVNDKVIKPGQTGWRTPLVTEGEFGLLLARVFAAESEAKFEWSGWETFEGKAVAVFNYSVAKEHSSLKLTLSDIAKAIVPYYGSIYADPATGSIWSISSRASDIPSEVRTKSISTTIDYEEITIGSQVYLLPTRATVWLTTSTGNMRNDIRFEGYRKFEADSTITYTSDTESGAENKLDIPAQPRHPPEPK